MKHRSGYSQPFGELITPYCDFSKIHSVVSTKLNIDKDIVRTINDLTSSFDEQLLFAIIFHGSSHHHLNFLMRQHNQFQTMLFLLRKKWSNKKSPWCHLLLVRKSQSPNIHIATYLVVAAQTVHRLPLKLHLFFLLKSAQSNHQKTSMIRNHVPSFLVQCH